MRKKIVYLFVGCFIVFILSMLIILYNVYSKQLYSELTKRSDYEDGLITQQMDNLTQNVESCCNNVIMEINRSMADRNLKDSSNETTKEKLLRVAEDNFLLFKEVSEISVLYNTGELFTKERSGNFSFTADNMELVKEMKSTDADTRGMWYQRGKEDQFVYFLKYLSEIKWNNQVGYIILKINEDTIYKSFKGKKTEGISQIFVFDKAGYLLSANQRDILKQVLDKKDVEAKLSCHRKQKRSLGSKNRKIPSAALCGQIIVCEPDHGRSVF